jgi:hypothetical protein
MQLFNIFYRRWQGGYCLRCYWLYPPFMPTQWPILLLHPLRVVFQLEFF